MALLPSVIEIIILFALIVISIFWLLDSNFSILLNFVLLYVIIGLLIIFLGYEFLGISMLLIYSSGIAIIFIITSMIVGTKHISVLSKNNEGSIGTEEQSQNKILFSCLYILFFILLFLTMNFTQSNEDNIFNILVQSSFSGSFTANSLILLNDVFIIGFLIYNQYSIHTVIGAFILTISLIASIYISQA